MLDLKGQFLQQALLKAACRSPPKTCKPYSLNIDQQGLKFDSVKAHIHS